MSLAAPVDGRDRKPSLAQIAHGLEIFFDVLAAPLEDANRALAVGRWRPARKSDFGAVRGLDCPGNGIFRNRVGGNRDERHGTDREAENSCKVKGNDGVDLASKAP